MVVQSKQFLALAALVATYLEARRRVLESAEKTGNRIGPRWLGLLAWKFLYGYSRLVGVNLASEAGEGLTAVNSANRYLIVWHPHGFIAWSALFIASKMAVEGHPHGREWFAMVAPALFRIPIISEALMLVNARRVDKKVVENLCAKGKSIAIQPGGVREQLVTRHDQEQAVFPANLGFIRMAIKHGMDLLPAYIFNENQMFKRVKGFDSASEAVYRKTGFGLPMVTAKGGLPMFGLLPHATDIHVRWGSPVPVGPPEENPSDERVEELFGRYVEALNAVFDKYAHECLPPEVAARGLKIIRLDGQPLPTRAAPIPEVAVVQKPVARARRTGSPRRTDSPVMVRSAL